MRRAYPGVRERAQRGVALITALLVVAIAAAAAVALAERQQIAIQRSANFLNADQAWQYALGAETFARNVLRRDRENNSTDHLEEGWATLLPPTALDEGELFGRLQDLEARFNVNGMVAVDGQPVERRVAQFQRLLQSLDLPAGLAWNVVDWIDADQDPSPGRGAEDLEYLRKQPAYRSAGRPLASPSELLLIDGFDMESYRRLEAHVTALPNATPINVNTATPEVLQSLSELLTPVLAEALIDERGDGGYPDAATFQAQFRALVGLGAADADGIETADIAVASHHFLFSGEAHFGRGRVALASLLLRRDDGQVTVLRRSRGSY